MQSARSTYLVCMLGLTLVTLSIGAAAAETASSSATAAAAHDPVNVPEHIQTRLNYAQRIYYDRQFKDALTLYRGIAKAYPCVAAFEQCAMISNKLGRNSEAVRYYKRVLKLKMPQKHKLTSLRALIQLYIDESNPPEYSNALPYLNRLIQHEQDTEMYQNLVHAYMYTNQLDRALYWLQQLQKYVAQHPEYAVPAMLHFIQFNQAHIHYAFIKNSEAVENIRAVLAQPEHIETLDEEQRKEVYRLGSKIFLRSGLHLDGDPLAVSVVEKMLALDHTARGKHQELWQRDLFPDDYHTVPATLHGYNTSMRRVTFPTVLSDVSLELHPVRSYEIHQVRDIQLPVYLIPNFMSGAEISYLRQLHDAHFDALQHPPLVCFSKGAVVNSFWAPQHKPQATVPKIHNRNDLFDKGLTVFCYNGSRTADIHQYLKPYSKSTMIDQTENEFADLLAERMEGITAGALNPNHALYTQLLKYDPGEDYEPHTDCEYLPGQNARTWTVLTYLNEPAPQADGGSAGGETEFPVLGLKIRPVAGMAVIFRSLDNDGFCSKLSLHQSNRVMDPSYHKYVLQKWYMKHAMNTDQQRFTKKKSAQQLAAAAAERGVKSRFQNSDVLALLKPKQSFILCSVAGSCREYLNTDTGIHIPPSYAQHIGRGNNIADAHEEL